MLAVKGYFDGVSIKPLEKIIAKPNQKVIITIIDDFIEQEEIKPQKGLRGILAKYADKNLAKKEKEAWESSVREKYDTI